MSIIHQHNPMVAYPHTQSAAPDTKHTKSGNFNNYSKGKQYRSNYQSKRNFHKHSNQSKAKQNCSPEDTYIYDLYSFNHLNFDSHNSFFYVPEEIYYVPTVTPQLNGKNEASSPSIIYGPPIQSDNLVPSDVYRAPTSTFEGPKGSGIIPYCLKDSELLFLLQKEERGAGGGKKNAGWNDFGGKRIMDKELPHNTAAREFAEETSCLFYLRNKLDTDATTEDRSDTELLFSQLKDNPSLIYDKKALKSLVDLIPVASKMYEEKIASDPTYICVNSNHAYSTYFIEVPYVPAEELPRAEDIHIPYKNRYIRSCKWFTMAELNGLARNHLHKRLHLARIISGATEVEKKINPIKD